MCADIQDFEEFRVGYWFGKVAAKVGALVPVDDPRTPWHLGYAAGYQKVKDKRGRKQTKLWQ